jgi:MFS family permease
LTASLRGADRRGLIQIVALLIYSCAQTLFAVIGALTGQLWVAVPFLVIAGAAESVYMATNATLIQLHAPDHLRGRVVGVLQASFVMVPVGVLSAGAFADVFGAPAVGIAYGCCAIAISLVFLLAAPSVRGLRLSRYVGRDAAQTGASKGGAP